MNKTKLKIIDNKKETFKIIISAVNKLVNMIAPTYGPSNNKVIIDKFLYKMVVDDGVQVASDFKLSDPSENSIIDITKEVAIKTSDRSKDGTTGSLIMSRAIINELKKRDGFLGYKIELELKKAVKEVRDYLKKKSVIIKTKQEMETVARISFNDSDVAKMLSELFSKIGKDGDVSFEKSPTMKTYYETNDGIKIKNGYISPYMVNNPEKMECVMDKPYIFITDYRLTDTDDVLELMNKMSEVNKNNLVIIADNVEQKALACMIVNQPHVINPETRKKGTFPSVAIVAPSGEDRNTTLEDIALLTGGKVFSEAKGDKLEDVQISDLGRANKFISMRESSLIINPKGDKSVIATSITSLRSAIENEKEEKKKEKLKKRLGLFTNTVATIKVGAPTDNEQKTILKKIENATYSVKSALNGGVVAGGGFELARIKTSSELLNNALKHPSRQLFENMGIINDPSKLKNNEAMNVITGLTGDFMEVGVCDPVDVLISGVESAVSITSVLITSSGILSETDDSD